MGMVVVAELFRIIIMSLRKVCERVLNINLVQGEFS